MSGVAAASGSDCSGLGGLPAMISKFCPWALQPQAGGRATLVCL